MSDSFNHKQVIFRYTKFRSESAVPLSWISYFRPLYNYFPFIIHGKDGAKKTENRIRSTTLNNDMWKELAKEVFCNTTGKETEKIWIYSFQYRSV